MRSWNIPETFLIHVLWRLINGLIETYESLLESDPERELELKDRLLNFLNSQKAYTGMLKGIERPDTDAKEKRF